MKGYNQEHVELMHFSVFLSARWSNYVKSPLAEGSTQVGTAPLVTI